jgi:hypothetical protein
VKCFISRNFAWLFAFTIGSKIKLIDFFSLSLARFAAGFVQARFTVSTQPEPTKRYVFVPTSSPPLCSHSFHFFFGRALSLSRGGVSVEKLN